MNLNSPNPALPALNHAKILTLGEPRNRNLVRTIESQGFKVELVQGVDARQLGRDGLEGFVDTAFLEAIREGLSDGEIACSVGHRNIYQKILSQNLELALVLEDDALPSDRIIEVFTELHKMKLEKPSVVSLFFPKRNSPLSIPTKLKLAETDVQRLITPPRHTVAYIINRKACEILLLTPKVVGRADWPITANLIDFYGVEPQPVHHSAADSFIDEDRGSRRIRSSLSTRFPQTLHGLILVFEKISPKRLYMARSAFGSWRITLTRYFLPQSINLLFVLWKKLRSYKRHLARRHPRD